MGRPKRGALILTIYHYYYLFAFIFFFPLIQRLSEVEIQRSRGQHVMLLAMYLSFSTLLWPVYSHSGRSTGKIDQTVLNQIASLSFGNDTQSILVSSLLRHYTPKVRPVRDHRDAVNVSIIAKPYQLLDVDEVNQCIVVNMWMTETWYDQFLYWDPQKFDNISELRLPHDDVWKPDTYLYNNLEMQQENVVRYMNVVLRPNRARRASHVTLQYPAIFRITCHMDVTNFPFDLQDCYLKFGSWTYDEKGIDYYPDTDRLTLTYLAENQEWDVLRMWAYRNATKYNVRFRKVTSWGLQPQHTLHGIFLALLMIHEYEMFVPMQRMDYGCQLQEEKGHMSKANPKCCPNAYVSVMFHLTIQRKSLFYTVNLIVPSVVVALINFIGFFTLSSSDGSRNEKVTLGITTLLALGVILLQLADHTPQSSVSVPIVGTFILCLIVLVGVGTVMTVVIVHFHFKGECGDPPTRWLYWILYAIGFLVGYTPGTVEAYAPKGYATVETNFQERPPSFADPGRFSAPASPQNNVSPKVSITDNAIACDLLGMTAPTAVLDEIKKIRKMVEKMTVEDQSSTLNPKRSEWIICAAAVERFCLILFVSLAVILTMWFFMSGYLQQLKTK